MEFWDQLIELDLQPTQEDYDKLGITKGTLITEGSNEPFLQIQMKGRENIINFLRFLKNDNSNSSSK